MSEPTSGDWMYSGGYPAFVAAPDENEPGNAAKAMVCNLDNRLEEYRRPQDEIDANGHLIAAAPELYEAASYLLAHEDADPDDNLDQDTYSEAWEFLKEAVAKVEGRKAT